MWRLQGFCPQHCSSQSQLWWSESSQPTFQILDPVHCRSWCTSQTRLGKLDPSQVALPINCYGQQLKLSNLMEIDMFRQRIGQRQKFETSPPFLPSSHSSLLLKTGPSSPSFPKWIAKLYLKCTVSFGRNSWEIIRYEEFYKFILVFLWYVTIQKGWNDCNWFNLGLRIEG